MMSTNKPFLKRRHRAPLSITKDILQACMDAGIEGILISKVSNKANLSYDAVIANCQKLIDAGLINSIKNKRNYIFIITEKGIKIFQELQKFRDIAREMNIKY